MALGVSLIEVGCAAWLEGRMIHEPHTEDAHEACFVEVVTAAAVERIFANGHWAFRDDNLGLQTIHRLGGGNFALVGRILRAKPL